jgi:hypothetical protein
MAWVMIDRGEKSEAWALQKCEDTRHRYEKYIDPTFWIDGGAVKLNDHESKAVRRRW